MMLFSLVYFVKPTAVAAVVQGEGVASSALTSAFSCARVVDARGGAVPVVLVGPFIQHLAAPAPAPVETKRCEVC